MSNLVSTRPTHDEYFAYYDTYVSKVPDGNIVERLEGQLTEVRSLLEALSEEEAETIHPPYNLDD